MRKSLTVLATACLVAACTGTPEVETGEDAEVVMGNLHKIDNARADMAYIDPEADFTKYRKVLVSPLGVDNVEITQPQKTTSVTNKRDWVLTDEDKLKLQSAYRDAMVKYLEDKGSFPVVEEPGDDVLQIAAALTGIAPSAAKDDNRSRPTGRSRVYTEGSGSLAVAVVYGDSETGEVLALFKDSRATQNNWGANNSVTNMADVKRLFNSWAIQINDGLEKVTAGALQTQ